MAALMMAASVAQPVAAQNSSPGYVFLKAVKDRDGNKATEQLSQPGNTLVNSRDLSSGQTALHIVVARRDTTWLRFLLEKGADPNIADASGVTPLQLATTLSYLDGVAVLSAAGADVNKTNSTGETPLMFAIHSRDLAMIRTLLEAGADPDRADSSGRTARDYAQRMGAGSEVVLGEMDKASAKLKGKAARAYGPGI